MKNITQRLIINVDKKNKIPVWEFKQEDDGVLLLSLYKNSIELNLEGQKLKLGCTRADGAVIELTEGITINGNNVDIQLKNNILAKAGFVECDLEISDSTGKMTTATFIITVSKKMLGTDNIEASNDVSAINKLIADVQAKAIKLDVDIKKLVQEANSKITEIDNRVNERLLVIQKDYDSLKKVIIDENAAANLQDQVNQTNAQLDNINIQINNIEIVLYPNGTDDTSQIQNAMDYCDIYGGTIKLCYGETGVFKVSKILYVGNNTTIKCESGVRITRISDEVKAFIFCKRVQTHGVYGAVSNVTIDGGVWDMHYGNFMGNTLNFIHCSNIIVRNATFIGCRMHTIELNSTNNALVENCTFSEFLYSANNKEVIQIDVAMEGSVGSSGAVLDNTPSKNITIKDCKFYSNETQKASCYIGGHSNSDLRYENIKIINNEFVACSGYAIRNLFTDNCEIIGNKFSYCHGGIYVYNDNKNFKIKDNSFDQLENNAIRLDNLTDNFVVDNNSFNTVKSFLIVNHSFNSLEIINNKAKKLTDRFINIANANNNNTGEHLLIENNQLREVEVSPINISVPIKNLFINNNIVDKTTTGHIIYVLSVCDNVYINNNILNNVNGNGITVYRCKNVFVKNNTIKQSTNGDNTKYLINLSSTYTDGINALIKDNDLVGGNTQAIRNDGYSNTYSVNNTFNYNSL